MKFLRTLPFVVLLLLSSLALAENGATPPSIEKAAQTDFENVKKGKLPKFAVRDSTKPDLADGGTTFWKGNGYTLTIKKTLTQEKGKFGYIYGPIIEFENPKIKGMASTKFYSTKEIGKLLESKP